jgi:hypothetical protein
MASEERGQMMEDYWFGFFVGLFIGANVGVLVIGLLVGSRKQSNEVGAE